MYLEKLFSLFERYVYPPRAQTTQGRRGKRAFRPLKPCLSAPHTLDESHPQASEATASAPALSLYPPRSYRFRLHRYWKGAWFPECFQSPILHGQGASRRILPFPPPPSACLLPERRNAAVAEPAQLCAGPLSSSPLLHSQLYGIYWK